MDLTTQKMEEEEKDAEAGKGIEDTNAAGAGSNGGVENASYMHTEAEDKKE